MTKKKKTKRRRTVYIAGPMRGLPDSNFPAFFQAEKMLKKRGFKVINPARMDVEIDGFEGVGNPKHDQRVYAERDLMEIIRECTHIYMLRGWSLSVGGALAEGATSGWIGLKIMFEDPRETKAVLDLGEKR